MNKSKVVRFLPASADVPAIAEPIAGQVHQRCMPKCFSDRWSQAEIEMFKQ
jgi:hypothetical protein